MLIRKRISTISKPRWRIPSCTPAIARSAPLRSLIACVMICASLALAGKTHAQEIVSQTDPAPATTFQSSVGKLTHKSSSNTSDALLRVIALRQELEAQVKALSRLVAYQKELLALANTQDSAAVLRARRHRQSCRQEINATQLCNALRASFADDRQNRGDGG